MFDDIMPIQNRGKICLYMQQGYGYVTAAGVHFTKDNPFQLIDPDEFYVLMDTGRFRIANKDEIRNFYNI